jgi:hypothetical protein
LYLHRLEEVTLVLTSDRIHAGGVEIMHLPVEHLFDAADVADAIEQLLSSYTRRRGS